MSVYIEYVILDNFVIDYIILYAVSKTLKLYTRRLRLILSSGLGTALAIILPLVTAPQLILFIIKLVCGFGMTVIISPFKLKKIILSYIFFVTYTFVLGGCIIGVLYLADADIHSAATLSYSYTVPIGLIAGICFVYIMLMLRLVRYIYKKRNILPFIRQITITYDGKDYHSTGFIDSGNRLYDDSGNPVILLSPQLLHKILPEEIIIKLYSGTIDSKVFTKKEFITAHYKKSYMYLFKIVGLLIYSEGKVNKIVNVSAGAMFGGFKGIEGCEVLLHGDMTEDF